MFWYRKSYIKSMPVNQLVSELGFSHCRFSLSRTSNDLTGGLDQVWREKRTCAPRKGISPASHGATEAGGALPSEFAISIWVVSKLILFWIWTLEHTSRNILFCISFIYGHDPDDSVGRHVVWTTIDFHILAWITHTTNDLTLHYRICGARLPADLSS